MRSWGGVSVVSLILLVVNAAWCQVKPDYLYNTGMPYGTLDLRTKISASNYYYLKEGSTFSFRESSPGVKTNTYLDMTEWDSSPYKEGHMLKRDGASDKFVINYRLLHPANYQSTYAEGYPLIVFFHGAIERANCYYGNCYHANSKYDPNVNQPPAPTSADHKLLNNDNHLIMGGMEHLKARNAAGSKLPNDPTLSPSAFPGFVLMPQMMNVWDSVNVQDVIRLVLLHCEKYNIDKNRIYVEGISIGGYGVYEALKRASWLFAAGLPLSAVSDAANIFRQSQQHKVAHVPLWAFQGVLDKNPTPQHTESIIQRFRAAGGAPKYTLYENMAHRVWERAWIDPTFFEWILKQNKSNVHVHGGNTVIDKTKNQFPKLLLAEGFLSYQWEKDGVIISTAKTHELTIAAPGNYRARFSRVSATPTESQWNKWSQVVTITEVNAEPEPPGEEEPGEEEPGEEEPGEEEPGEEEPGEEEPGEEEPSEEEPGEEEPGEGESPGEEPGNEPEENPEGENPPDETPGGETGGETPDNEEPTGEPGSEQPTDPAENPGSGDEENPSGETPANPPGEEPQQGGDGNPDPGSDPPGETPVDNPSNSGNEDPELEEPEIVTAINPDPAIKVEVYPNPAITGEIQIEISNVTPDPLRIIIFDTQGKPVYDTRFNSMVPHFSIQHKLRPGMYWIKVSSARFKESKKLIISDR
jgi:hypothetical protein